MLRTFIFNEVKSQWVEEEHVLLSHEICAILDEEREIIYLLNSPKSSREAFRKGYKQIKELGSNFPELNIQYVIARKNIPEDVKKKVDSMIESAKLTKGKILKFSRFTTIRIYSISILLAVFFPIFYFLNLSTSFFWSSLNGNYRVSNIIYNKWINYSKTFIIISLIFIIINIIIGIIEKESQVIIFSFNGILISFGLLIYLNQGIYLFIFQEGSSLTRYLISHRDIFFFLFLNLIAFLILEIPNIYKLISFFKTYHKFIF
ncbi:MAG: hypothetical protein ACFE91_03310 [Promethearchaeota archaeon]